MSNIYAFNASQNAPVTIDQKPVVIDQPSHEIAQDYTGKAQEFFSVDNLPLSSHHGIVKNKKGIFVETNCINVVSPSYEVHQPIEIFNTFTSVAAESGLAINRVLTNKTNGGLLISAKYDDCRILGEAHDVNLTFYTSHCGKYKTFLTLDLLRIACFNQTPVLYKNKERHLFAEKHYKNALNLDMLSTLLTGIPESVTAYNEKAESLQGLVMTYSAFVDFYIQHYKMDTNAKQFDTKVANLKNVYYNATGQGQLGANAYKAYQAITFINTHEGRNTSMKNERVLVQGSNDSLKALEGLLAAA